MASAQLELICLTCGFCALCTTNYKAPFLHNCEMFDGVWKEGYVVAFFVMSFVSVLIRYLFCIGYLPIIGQRNRN